MAAITLQEVRNAIKAELSTVVQDSPILGDQWEKAVKDLSTINQTAPVAYHDLVMHAGQMRSITEEVLRDEGDPIKQLAAMSKIGVLMASQTASAIHALPSSMLSQIIEGLKGNMFADSVNWGQLVILIYLRL